MAFRQQPALQVGRQLPCCRHAIHMGQFGYGIASEDLGTIAAAILIDQPGDQRDLRQKNGADGQNFHPVSFPCGRIAKEDLAAGRQAALADAPALHLPPVEHRACKLDGRRIDVARLLSAEDANGNGSCLSAGISRREQRPAHDLAAEEGFVIGKNRCLGDGVQP